MSSSQGGKANRQGHVLEETVSSVFRSHGFVEIIYSDYIKNNSDVDGDYLIRSVPYTTIYEHPGKTEFLALSARLNLQARIECKWQQSQGSVDEKFPYLFLNCIEMMPERTIVLLIDGGGYKKGALKWLKNAVEQYTQDDSSKKEIFVFNIAEFVRWANRSLS